MHVRIKRRYREGFELGKKEFGEQPWADGILVMDSRAGRNRLGLYLPRQPGVASAAARHALAA